MIEIDAQGGPNRDEVIKDFARSELFERTFQSGMELVEETAAYLDGAGRQESKLLSRSAALAFASISMRLTTRLMQVASWLLVQRAVREGDMAAAAACEERYRIAAETPIETPPDVTEAELPAGLLSLMERSVALYERVRHLDRRMYLDINDPEEANPVLSQMDRLKTAFGS
jgi:regulator of CtrA degradation